MLPLCGSWTINSSLWHILTCVTCSGVMLSIGSPFLILISFRECFRYQQRLWSILKENFKSDQAEHVPSHKWITYDMMFPNLTCFCGTCLCRRCSMLFESIVMKCRTFLCFFFLQCSDLFWVNLYAASFFFIFLSYIEEIKLLLQRV